jgi:aconitate hydratase
MQQEQWHLQFEAMGLKQVKTELSVSYVYLNNQVGFENADVQAPQTVAAKHGII